MKKPFYDNEFRLGILGGGQLGRMFIQEAINYNVFTKVLDPDPEAPCKTVAAEFHVGSLKDYDTVMAFGQDVDVLTIEIEHVNVDALEALEQQGIAVYPQPRVLRMVQDKGDQKLFYQEHKLPTAPFELATDKADVLTRLERMPWMQKMRRGGYDGRGVTPIRNEADLEKAFDAPSVLESFVDFAKEVSVIAARNAQGEVATFPVVELDFNPEANLVEYLFSPANISEETEQQALELATNLVNQLELVGIVAVEMFLTKSGELLINEIAPRPHNSGHHSIEANYTSQYEQHLRAILGLPLGDTRLLSPAVMVNLLGEAGHTGPAAYTGLETVLNQPGVNVHLYGKKVTKPFRKMGHVTVIASEPDEAKRLAEGVKDTLKVISSP